MQGVDINKKNNDEETALFLAGNEKISLDLINLGADTSFIDTEGNSLLHKAVSKNWVDFTKFLIHEGLDIHQKNLQGETPFDIAKNKYKKFDVEYDSIMKLLDAVDYAQSL